MKADHLQVGVILPTGVCLFRVLVDSKEKKKKKQGLGVRLSGSFMGNQL
jgi:hypothetical protein